ncbi:MAG: carbon storage regulator CsrA [Alphaproteobacteria bacterium]
MLYLKRHIGESVIIGDNIQVRVMEVRGKSVKLGFEFPSHVSVLREEIHKKIQQENKAAAASGEGLMNALARSSSGGVINDDADS